jgi:hypothetical protein
LIDEREPGSEFAAAVTVARPRPKAPTRPTEAEAESPNGSSAPPSGVADRRPARASNGTREDVADLPVSLVRSMQAAAKAHRERVAEQIELRRVAILAAIRDQRRADAVRARQRTAESRRAVDAWAATAQRQIKTERQRRKVELDADLRRTLREQNLQVDRRVRDIEAALAAHRAELDAFFDTIERERDPVAIARHARQRPAFPELPIAAATEPDPRSAAGADGGPETDAAQPPLPWDAEVPTT